MAGPGTIRAGRAAVEVTLTDKLDRGLRRAQAKLRSFAAGAKRIGTAMTGMATSLGIPIAFATKTFADFEDQMAIVRAVTSASGNDFAKLTDTAKELGRTTSFTAGQVADGMISLGRAGFSAAEILDSIPSVLDLSRASAVELGEATDIAAGTLRAFGLAATDMERVADVLTATANNSAQTLTDLGESMKYAAPIAEEYGMSLEQTAKALGVLANMQIKGSMAGTSLRQIMLRLADPKVQGQLKAIGVNALDSAGQLRPLGDIMLELGKAMANMSNAERIKLGEDLFDRRAVGGALKLAKSNFPALEKAIDQAGGTAKRTAKTMNATLGGAFRRLLSAAEGVMLAIGDALKKALEDLAAKLTAVAGWVTKVIEANKGLVVIIAQVVKWLGVAGVGLLAMAGVTKILATALGGLSGVIKAVAIALRGLWLVAGAVASPVGLIVAAVGVAAAVFVDWRKVMAAVTDFVSRNFGDLVGRIGAAINTIKQLVSRGDLSGALRVGAEAMKLLWAEMVHFLMSAWVDFKGQFIGSAPDFVESVKGWWKTITNVVAGAVQMISSLWNSATEYLGSAWNAVAGFIGEKFKGVSKMIADEGYSMADAWYDAQLLMVQGFAGIEKAWVNTTTFLANAWTKFTTGFKSGWGTAQNWISKKFLGLMKLFDKDLDVEQVSKILDDDFAKDKNARNKAAEEAIASREAERKKRVDAINDERDQTMAAVEDRRQAARREAEQAANAQRDDLDQSLADARANFDKAMQDALPKPGEKPGVNMSEKMDDFEAAVADAEAAFAGMKAGKGGVAGADLAAGVGKVSSAGTFSAAAVRGMGSISAAEKTAENTKRTADGIDKLNKNTKRNALAFA